MKKHVVARTGKPCLEFEGELLVEASSQENQGPSQNRYHQILVYRTAKGRWVVLIRFDSHWQGELSTDTAHVCETEEEVARVLTEYDPTEGWHGHPPGAQDAERKNKLYREAIGGAYRAMASRTLETMRIVERID